MQIVHNQLRGPERIFFASVQAVVCGVALYLGYTAVQVLLLDASTPGGLNGGASNLVFSLLLALCLVTAAGSAFLCWTFARGARIGATRREAFLFRAVLALVIVGSAVASVALRP